MVLSCKEGDVSDRTFSHMVGHVFARQHHLTASVMEVTWHDCQQVTVDHVVIGRLALFTVLTRVRPLWAALKLVACDVVSTDALLAVEALDHGKLTAFQLAWGLGVRVQMFVQLPQFARPLAAAEAMGAVDAELQQGLFQALVGDVCERLRTSTLRTRLAFRFDVLDAGGTEVVSAAVAEVRLAKDLEADGALALQLLLRWLDKLAIVTRSSRRFVVIGVLTSHFLCWHVIECDLRRGTARAQCAESASEMASGTGYG